MQYQLFIGTSQPEYGDDVLTATIQIENDGISRRASECTAA